MSGRSILVNANQKGNPLLNFIKNSHWEYAEIVPDYSVGASNCILFLSLKYHRLHPEYIQMRLEEVKLFRFKVLLVLVDVNSNQTFLRELNFLAFKTGFTLILAWSDSDAAKYVETFKSFENKHPDYIRERVDDNSFSRLSNCLTQVKAISKTDVNPKEIFHADVNSLRGLPGFGGEKVKQFLKAMDQPFIRESKIL